MAIQIEFTKQAEKQVRKIPRSIKDKITWWIDSLKEIGWAATSRVGGAGLHDEPLKGNREGQRSIRLNRSWRLIYTLDKGVLVIREISHHEYK